MQIASASPTEPLVQRSAASSASEMLSSATGQASKRSKTIGPSSAGEQPISTAAPNTRMRVGPERAERVQHRDQGHREQHPHLEAQREAVVEAGRLRDHERDERERRVLEEELVVGDLAVEQLLRVALVQRHVAAAAVRREVHVGQARRSLRAARGRPRPRARDVARLGRSSCALEPARRRHDQRRARRVVE